MSAQELTNSLMSELMAIQAGECIWCQRGKAHPDYSRCLHKNDVFSGAGFIAVADTGRLAGMKPLPVGFRI